MKKKIKTVYSKLNMKQKTALYLQVEEPEFELLRIRYVVKASYVRHKETEEVKLIAFEIIDRWIENRKKEK